MSYDHYKAVLTGHTVPTLKLDNGTPAHPTTNTTTTTTTTLITSLNSTAASLTTTAPFCSTTVTAPSSEADQPEDDSNSDQTLQIQLKDITELSHGDRDEPEIFLTPLSSQTRKKFGRFENNALLIRRKKLYVKGKEASHLSTHLEIRDLIIQRALQEVLKPIRNLNLDATLVFIKEPFRELFWFRRELEEYRERRENSPEEQESYDLIVDFVKERLYKNLDAYERLVPNGFIDYEYLWTIFRPGCFVISVADGLLQALVVQSLGYVEQSQRDHMWIECVSWGCNSTTFGAAERRVEIQPFEGCIKIVDLDLYPLEHVASHQRDLIYQRLICRGKKWMSLINHCHKQYNGVAWELRRKSKSELRGLHMLSKHEVDSYERKRQQVDGRIFLDHDMALKFNPGSVYPLVRWTAQKNVHASKDTSTPETPFMVDVNQVYRKVYRQSVEGLTDQQALLCPSTVRGYSLEEKCWMEFDIEEVRDIEWNLDCFPKLQVNPSIRDNLRDLLTQHHATSDDFQDVVAGKGKGLILLLYGPPGSGKTLTAEVLSEHCQKPLLRVTSGDLGTEPSTAEKKLQEIFKLAYAWRAVLLFDEADVFLAKRGTDDVVRNAFVTIFLRAMEYYPGVMILTTNRRDAFDEAFLSRIHLQILYSAATPVQRKAIWANIVHAQGTSHTLTDEAFGRLGTRYERNGREIKNLVSMAFLIAKSQCKALDETIVNAVCDMDARFNGSSSSAECG